MIVNRFIPGFGFSAINLFGIIFVRKGMPFNAADLQHERIHTRQMLELLVIPFYILYAFEWLVRLLQHRNFLRAYLAISFEREAYCHQSQPNYLQHRKHYAWWHYLCVN